VGPLLTQTLWGPGSPHLRHAAVGGGFFCPRGLVEINSNNITKKGPSKAYEKLFLQAYTVIPICDANPYFRRSVYMAAKQPDKKDVDLLKIGTPRSMLLAEFGAPSSSEIKDGKKCEMFKFVQGYSTGARAGRAVFHGVADVLTLGLWEVVGTPTEAVFSGDEMCFEVTYDEKDRIDQVTALKK
jgi:hypothetical protein